MVPILKYNTIMTVNIKLITYTNINNTIIINIMFFYCIIQFKSLTLFLVVCNKIYF